MDKGKTFIIVILLVLIGVFIMSGIVHKATKVSGEKGLATEWNDDHEQTGNHDAGQNQFLNQVIENRTDFPAGPVEGQIIWRSDLNAGYIWNGTSWSRYGMQTYYWHTEGLSFVPDDPKSFDFAYSFETAELIITTSAGDDFALCPVNLPHGAIVTAAVVYGSVAARTWYLCRDTIGTEMARANVNTEDTSISDATIDNQNHSYFLQVTTSNGDRIYHARITYTL